MVEQHFCKVKVGGSTPLGSTMVCPKTKKEHAWNQTSGPYFSSVACLHCGEIKNTYYADLVERSRRLPVKEETTGSTPVVGAQWVEEIAEAFNRNIKNKKIDALLA